MSYNNPDNRFTGTTGQSGAGEFTHSGARNLGPTTHQETESDRVYKASNLPSGVPAPHMAGGTTHGSSRHDNDPANFRGERGAEFVGRGPTHESASGYGGPGTATGYGPPSSGAAAAGMGMSTHRDVTNTGVDNNPQYQASGDPTFTGTKFQDKFSNTGPGVGTGTHTATGMHTDNFANTRGTNEFAQTRGPGFDDQHAHAGFNENQGTFNEPNRGRGPASGTAHTSLGDRIKGTMDKMVGKATDNPQLQQQGEAQKQTGQKY